MDETRMQFWARKTAWSLREAAWLLCGEDHKNPNAAASTEPYNEARDELIDAVRMGDLAAVVIGEAGAVVYDQQYRFRPADVIAWAGDRFPNFPLQGMATLQEAQPAKESAKERNLRHKVIGALLNARGEWPTSGQHFAQILEKHGCKIGEKTAKTILDEARDQISS